MASYSQDELKNALKDLIQNDEEVREELQKAVRAKEREWITQIVTRIATICFETAAKKVVETVVDWLLKNIHLFF